jgi:hypothetical protein
MNQYVGGIGKILDVKGKHMSGMVGARGTTQASFFQRSVFHQRKHSDNMLHDW